MNASEAKRGMDYAEKDLRAARALLESGEFFPRQICFLAQQCAEKSIKAILVFDRWIFRRTTTLIVYET